jgi:hypothetical protein
MAGNLFALVCPKQKAQKKVATKKDKKFFIG